MLLLREWLSAHESAASGDTIAADDLPGYHFGGKAVRGSPNLGVDYPPRSPAQSTTTAGKPRRSASAVGTGLSAVRAGQSTTAPVNDAPQTTKPTVDTRAPTNRVASAPARRAKKRRSRSRSRTPTVSVASLGAARSVEAGASAFDSYNFRVSEYAWDASASSPIRTHGRRRAGRHTREAGRVARGSTGHPPRAATPTMRVQPSAIPGLAAPNNSVAGSVGEASQPSSARLAGTKDGLHKRTTSEQQLRVASVALAKQRGLAGGDKEHRDTMLQEFVGKHGQRAAAAGGVDALELGTALEAEQRRRKEVAGGTDGEAATTAQPDTGDGTDDTNGAAGPSDGDQTGASMANSPVLPDELFEGDDFVATESHITPPTGGDQNERDVQSMLQTMRHSQAAYAVTFNEIVRQVSVGCVERGQLLAKVWQRFLDMFNQLATVRLHCAESVLP